MPCNDEMAGCSERTRRTAKHCRHDRHARGLDKTEGQVRSRLVGANAWGSHNINMVLMDQLEVNFRLKTTDVNPASINIVNASRTTTQISSTRRMALFKNRGCCGPMTFRHLSRILEIGMPMDTHYNYGSSLINNERLNKAEFCNVLAERMPQWPFNAQYDSAVIDIQLPPPPVPVGLRG